MLLGAGLLASAAVCWIAANWPYATSLQKLAGTQVALGGGALLACWRLWRRPGDIGVTSLAANALGLAAVLAGALFALIGQIYQTGADPWQLFAVWTALLLPWSLALPTVFMLCLLATVLNTAVALFLTRELGLDWVPVAACMTALNTALLALREAAGVRLADDPWRIAPRAAMMALAGWWLTGLGYAVMHNIPYGLMLGWPGLVLGAVLTGVYTRARPDAAMLSLLGLTACAAACLLILNAMGMDTGLPVVIVLLVLAFIFGARHLLAVVRAGKAPRHPGEEPWFISAFRLVLMGLAALMCLLFAMLVLELEETAGSVLGAVLVAGGLWAVRANLARPAVRDVGIVLTASGYVMYGICVLDIGSFSFLSVVPVAAAVLPAVLIYAAAPLFALRFFSALIGLGILLLYWWSVSTSGWWGDDAGMLRSSYEKLLALSLASLAVWGWVARDERRRAHAALGWALICLTLVSGWWAPALHWDALVQGVRWSWVLGLALVALPLYALAAIMHGSGKVLILGAALVLLVASVGWLGAPGVAVALTWLLMGRVLQRPALIGLSGVALLTYLAQFYYQLETPLLHKAWVLGATGAWILLGAMVLAGYRQGWRRKPAGQQAAQGGRARWRLLVVLAGLLAILAAANWTIAQREHVLRHGQAVILQLAPVDPRSLMQGDYMVLRYEVADEAQAMLEESPELSKTVRSDGRGVLLLAPDADGVHRLRGIESVVQAQEQGAAGDAVRLAFRLRDGHMWIVTDAWFFAEGLVQHYAQARYGLFRVDGQGNGVLVDLLDERREGLKSREPR